MLVFSSAEVRRVSPCLVLVLLNTLSRSMTACTRIGCSSTRVKKQGRLLKYRLSADCQEREKSFRNFLAPSEKPKVIYTDYVIEFGKSCEDLSWNHRTSTHHGSETNGIAERAVRRMKEGTSAALLQSGLDEKW